MQNAPCKETPGDQEDIIRGTRQRKFCPPPRLKSRREKSISGVNFSPIDGINAGVDVFAVVGQVSRPPPRRALKRNVGSDQVRPSEAHLGGHIVTDVPKENLRNGQTSVARSDVRCSEQ
jgi:hypothetical protein